MTWLAESRLLKRDAPREHEVVRKVSVTAVHIDHCPLSVPRECLDHTQRSFDKHGAMLL